MTETDFKKGDTVEVVNIYGHTHDNRVGAKGTITSVLTGGTAYVRVENEDNARFGQTLVFYPNELKLVKPEQKFQVGAEVTFCMPDFEGWQGGAGIVRSVPSEDREYYKVEIVTPPPTNNAQRPGNRVDLLPEWIEAAPKPEPKFKKGDIVKSVGFQYMKLKGKTLIVDSVETQDSYPYRLRALGEDYEKGHNFREDELVAGEPLAEWEIELLDSSRPSLKSKALADYAVADVKATANLFAKGEAVKHPAHYGGGDNPYEAIKVIEAWGLGFNLGNAAKYLARAGKKGNKVEDLKKLIQYVQFEIAKEEAK